MSISYEGRQTFTVPAGAGSYAPERIQLNSQNANQKSLPFNGVNTVVEVAVGSAVFELWLLGVGLDPTNDANYAMYNSVGTPGNQTFFLGGGWHGGQIRVKSGGTAGNETISSIAGVS